MPQNDRALLVRLQEHGVEFVIIGGVCGALHGLPLVTFDLDICCPFDVGNLRKLEASLTGLHPFHRMTPAKIPFEIDEELALRLKNLYLETDLGKLDCLSEVVGIGTYTEVLQRSTYYQATYGQFRMLDLDALILAKETIGRERDLQAVRILRAIKERKENS
jgi:hypothetical protein